MTDSYALREGILNRARAAADAMVQAAHEDRPRDYLDTFVAAVAADGIYGGLAILDGLATTLRRYTSPHLTFSRAPAHAPEVARWVLDFIVNSIEHRYDDNLAAFAALAANRPTLVAEVVSILTVWTTMTLERAGAWD